MFLFLISEKGTEKAELRGGCPLTYPDAAVRFQVELPWLRHGQFEGADGVQSQTNLCFRRLKKDGENREANKVRDRSGVRLAPLEIAAAPTAQARI